MGFPVLTQHCSAGHVSWAAFVPDQVAYLLVKLGDRQSARSSYLRALTLTRQAAQRDYLQEQIQLLHIS